MNAGREIADLLSDFVSAEFNMKIDADACIIGAFLYVVPVKPRIPFRIGNCSGEVIRKYFRQLELERGRPLTLEERWEFYPGVNEDHLINMGNTHRWSYLYFQRAPFLQYFFSKRGKMIRPAVEIELRALHPENEVKSLEDHRKLLLSLLIENCNNSHTVNHFQQWLYDSFWMEAQGISGWRSALRDVRRTFARDGFPNVDMTTLPQYENRNCRAWYRRQSTHTLFGDDNRFDAFMGWWEDKAALLEKARSFLDASEPLYWHYRTRIRRRLKGKGWHVLGGAENKRKAKQFRYFLETLLSSGEEEGKVPEPPKFQLSEEDGKLLITYIGNGFHIVGWDESDECFETRRAVDSLLCMMKLEGRR
jgi:hypothetical protein